MKTIKLQSMSLRYFKGIRELNINFNETTTNVFGENATGKTSVMDAFTWLLFGKDSQGRSDSNFEIKTLDEKNNVIEKVDHEVTAVLLVNGQKLIIKRVLRENWTKKRGEAIAVFTGNSTEYFFDEVPVSAGEYSKRISELMDEGLFKLITNPLYFNSLNWKDRRNILTSLSGDVSNELIVQMKPEFASLISSLNGRSLEDLKAKTAQQRKQIKDELDLIPARMDEVRRGIPEAENYEELECNINALNTKVLNIENQIADKSEAMNAVFTEISAQKSKINELKLKQSDVVFKARTDENNLLQQANSAIIEKENTLRNAKSKLLNIERELQMSENDMSIQSNLDLTNKRRSDKLNEWHTENNREFKHNAGELICPLYKNHCSDPEALKQFSENNEKAIAEFNQSKIINLERISREGQAIAEQIKMLNEQLTQKAEKETSLKSEINKQRKAVDALQTELSSLKSAEPKQIIPEELPDWMVLENQIQTIRSGIKEPAPVDNSVLNEEKRAINAEIDELKARLNNKSVIERAGKRLAELQDEEAKLAQQMADCEKIEFEILEFTKAKMEEVDRRVNSMFSCVKFKLFDKQINGAEIECCEALINTNGSWVPYTTGGNTAGKLNGGIDIINALCSNYGVTAPIFIDNRESVNSIIPTGSQIINLIVSSDKKLIVQ